MWIVHKARALRFALAQQLARWAESEQGVPSQPLLFPEQFPVSPSVVEEIESLEWLGREGLSLEAFGPSTLALKTIPLPMAGTGLHSGIVQRWLETGNFTRESWREAALDGTAERDWDARDRAENYDPAPGRDASRAGANGRVWRRWSLREIDRLFGEIP